MDQSRLVSPGAAKAAVTEPSPLSSQPTDRGMLEATSEAATLEVMPLVPVQEPLLRPATIAVTRSVGVRPLATVTLPLARSTKPPAFGASPPTAVSR